MIEPIVYTNELIFDPSKIINIDLVEVISRIGMSKENAELLVYLYENGKEIGFTAAELGFEEEEFMNFMDMGWVRVVNIKRIGKFEFCFVYKINDLYEILESIKLKKEEIYNNDLMLIKKSSGMLDEELVKLCRPKIRAGRKKYTPIETNERAIRRRKVKKRGQVVDSVKQMIDRNGKVIKKK